MDPEGGSQSGRVRQIESLGVHILLKPFFAIGSENSPATAIVNLPSRVGRAWQGFRLGGARDELGDLPS
jgi:hypothetical protein